MVLYLLRFEDEPLVKVGISTEPSSRWSQLGDARFDFERSCLVHSENSEYIRLLERNLKVLFAEYRRDSQVPLSSGNTEVFCDSALSKMLQMIEGFQQLWSAAGLCVQQGIASTTYRGPCLSSVSLTHEERLASLAERNRRKILETIAENEKKLTELERLALVIRFLSARVKQDSKFRYAIAVELDTTDDAAVRDLINASRMYTCAYQPRSSRKGRLYTYSPTGTAYGFECLSEPLNSGVGTLSISFDLDRLARVQAQSIEPDPIPWEAVAFWKGLVASLERKQTKIEAAS